MKVLHSRGEYEVVEGEISSALEGLSDVFVITDENVLMAWPSAFEDKPILAAKPGESSKSLNEYGECLAWLADRGANRSSTLVAFGGGVVGDLAGFVAATYMRGIPYIQIPTSLLAMVDSSVGGKVAIDLQQGKNLVGAFYPPARVVIDYRVLSTLPHREFVNGTAEIWKYGAILDWDLFEQLEAKPLGPGDDRLPQIVMHCVDLKRRIVEQDEHETTGTRAILNFGHTVGHALEKATGYGPLLHGEAIAAGMVFEARIGESLGLTPKGVAERIEAGLAPQGLPTSLSEVPPATLVESMRLDKKASGGRLAFALLDGYGSCKLVPDVPRKVVLDCLREHL